MSLYIQSYATTLKKNFMLLIMAFVLLVLTFFIWTGVPVFVVGEFVAGLTSNLVLYHLTISFSIGTLFSIYFVPLNINVAKHIATMKDCDVIGSFVRIQTLFIVISSL